MTRSYETIDMDLGDSKSGIFLGMGLLFIIVCSFPFNLILLCIWFVRGLQKIGILNDPNEPKNKSTVPKNREYPRPPKARPSR